MRFLLNVLTEGKDGDCVEIYADTNGLKLLRDSINTMLEHLDNGSVQEHEHYFIESWGGDGLSNAKAKFEDKRKMNVAGSLKITVWNSKIVSQYFDNLRET
ncbi:MAG: immunity protein 32 [Tatlockia sp.]|nr:immunity protein 32 [Tatlockia sp.]